MMKILTKNFYCLNLDPGIYRHPNLTQLKSPDKGKCKPPRISIKVKGKNKAQAKMFKIHLLQLMRKNIIKVMKHCHLPTIWQVQNDDNHVENSVSTDGGDDSGNVLGGCEIYMPSTSI